ncbi:hypothetical protein K440DRAFT_636563 [Wilcoxina mikolae CBS 423.85]|nr:hypothetical protein K440DRAFT_636563 [Wilcoxina mikolae CBS 423.85]
MPPSSPIADTPVTIDHCIHDSPHPQTKKLIKVIIRDSKHQEVFDKWYTTKSEKEIQWDVKKTSPTWLFFIHCASLEDDIPYVRCIICGSIYQHPGTQSRAMSPMKKHLDTA